jgi:hypothetical protein
MTAAPSLSLPGGRVLAGWWHDLAAHRPRQLWFAHLHCHRIEALAGVTRTRRLDPFSLALLRALDCLGRDRLRIDPQVLTCLLGTLEGEGLVRTTDGARRLTELGRHALASGAFTVPARERRVFYFVDNPCAGRPPHFLHLDRAAGVPFSAGPEWHFDLKHLQDCLNQPAEWKRRHRFPADVDGVFASGEPGDWRQVVLDRPEHLRLALIRGDGGLVLGFAVGADGWTVQPDAHAISLAEGGQEVFPELEQEPPPEAWRQAWLAWCQPRSLPTAEVEACRLERVEHRLLVRPPKRLLERLRTARNEVFKQDTWLLAGAGHLHTAALVEIVEPETSEGA